MDSTVNTLFDQVLPDKENSEVFYEACDIEDLRKEVVARLEEVDISEPVKLWWEDKALIALFMDAYKSGCISLPTDPVERFRWIALLCVEMSNIESYDCGDIVNPLYFLTADLMVVFEGLYGDEALELVFGVWNRLNTEGWDSVVGLK